MGWIWHTESELKQDLVHLRLHQLIDQPTYHTRTSSNILELIFTDSPGYVTEAGTLPPLGTSHHAVIYCVCNRTIKHNRPYTKEIWKYEETDSEGLNIAIGDFPFEDILHVPDDINHATEIWTHSILTIAREYIPNHNITIRPRDKPWIKKLEELKTSQKNFWIVAKQIYGNKFKTSIPTLIDDEHHCYIVLFVAKIWV